MPFRLKSRQIAMNNAKFHSKKSVFHALSLFLSLWDRIHNHTIFFLTNSTYLRKKG